MARNEHDLIDGKKPSAFFRDIAKIIRDTKVKLGPYNPDAPFARSITIKAPDEDGYKDIGKRLRKGEKVYGLLQKWKPPIGSTKFREEDADIEHLWDDRNDNLKSNPKGQPTPNLSAMKSMKTLRHGHLSITTECRKTRYPLNSA